MRSNTGVDLTGQHNCTTLISIPTLDKAISFPSRNQKRLHCKFSCPFYKRQRQEIHWLGTEDMLVTEPIIESRPNFVNNAFPNGNYPDFGRMNIYRITFSLGSCSIWGGNFVMLLPAISNTFRVDNWPSSEGSSKS